MNPNDPADAAARALDLLPQDDPAASDPRMLRDPALVREARETRETAAHTWLAVSPLRAAPPDLLPSILEKTAVRDAAPPPRPARRIASYLIAAGGWAAAAALLLWFRVSAPSGRASPPVPESAKEVYHSEPAGEISARRVDRYRRQAADIVRLREKLASLSGHDKSLAPRIISLSAPGSPPRDPEEVRKRVRDILANALRNALEAETGVSQDSAAWVIERGWPAAGSVTPPPDGYIRHRHFPEARWSELGLLRSGQGTYYDPATHCVWFPDPQGGGFVGRPLAAGEDISGFSAQGGELAQNSASSLPEGFLIQNPADGTAELLLSGFPPPKSGSTQTLVVTTSSGQTREIPVVPSATSIAAEGNGTTASAGAKIGYAPDLASMQPLAGGTSALSGAFASGGIIGLTNLGTNTTITRISLLETSVSATGQPVRTIIGGSP